MRLNNLICCYISVFIIAFGQSALGQSSMTQMQTIIDGSHRTAKSKARDVYRHPIETLSFFGVSKNSNVVEITPGRGWYTEILAPLLKDKGSLVTVIYDANLTKVPYLQKLNKLYKNKLANDKKTYGRVKILEIAHMKPDFKTKKSVDFVLTFRNVHNWAKSGTIDKMFDSFYKSLSTGGVLGVVEHRANAGNPIEQQIKSGYMTENYVKRIAKSAGFRFVSSSEINANPLDRKNHRNGVWTLLPNQRGLSEPEKELYRKIGESDRMTLKFIKN